MFIIMKKNMCIEIRNNNIYQFLGEATYRCAPLTFRNCKLYIKSGFNLKIKRTRLTIYALISNEIKATYLILFNNLKEKFGFESKIFTIDSQKSSAAIY